MISLTRELSFASSSMFAASLRPRSGSGCTSKNHPVAPNALAAMAICGTKRRSPPVLPSAPPRALYTVRAVHDDRRNYSQHVADVAEVDYQVVVPEHIAAFCKPNVFCTGIAGFLYGVTHILSAEELGLFDVYRAPGAGCGYQQVGLAAEESRYLQHVGHLACRLSLPTLVDVGKYPQPVTALYVCKHLHSTVKAGASGSELTDVRLALSNEALKMMSVPSSRFILTSSRATVSSSSADSMTHGPAIIVRFIFGGVMVLNDAKVLIITVINEQKRLNEIIYAKNLKRRCSFCWMFGL